MFQILYACFTSSIFLILVLLVSAYVCGHNLSANLIELPLAKRHNSFLSFPFFFSCVCVGVTFLLLPFFFFFMAFEIQHRIRLFDSLLRPCPPCFRALCEVDDCFETHNLLRMTSSLSTRAAHYHLKCDKKQRQQHGNINVENQKT